MRLEQRQLSTQKKNRRAIGNGNICFRKCCLAAQPRHKRVVWRMDVTMYVCLSHNARREEAAECWVLRFALDMMQGWLERTMDSVAPGR